MCSIHSRPFRHVQRVFCLCMRTLHRFSPTHFSRSSNQSCVLSLYAHFSPLQLQPTFSLSSNHLRSFTVHSPIQHDAIFSCAQVTTSVSFAHWIETCTHDHDWKPRPFKCLFSIITPLKMLLIIFRIITILTTCLMYIPADIEIILAIF